MVAFLEVSGVMAGDWERTAGRRQRDAVRRERRAMLGMLLLPQGYNIEWCRLYVL
jgi:hypothetical protein